MNLFEHIQKCVCFWIVAHTLSSYFQAVQLWFLFLVRTASWCLVSFSSLLGFAPVRLPVKLWSILGRLRPCLFYFSLSCSLYFLYILIPCVFLISSSRLLEHASERSLSSKGPRSRPQFPRSIDTNLSWLEAAFANTEEPLGSAILRGTPAFSTPGTATCRSISPQILSSTHGPQHLRFYLTWQTLIILNESLMILLACRAALGTRYLLRVVQSGQKIGEILGWILHRSVANIVPA